MALTDTPPEPTQSSTSILRKLLPFTTVGVVIAALYVAYVFYSRHQSEVDAVNEAAAKEKERQQRVVKTVFGSGEVAINTYTADKGHLARGEKTQLCYSISNATTMKLDPPVADVKPMYHNCVEISPKATTTYTITAGNDKGETKTASLTVQVQ